jgi:hypothetical protein
VDAVGLAGCKVEDFVEDDEVIMYYSYFYPHMKSFEAGI